MPFWKMKLFDVVNIRVPFDLRAPSYKCDTATSFFFISVFLSMNLNRWFFFLELSAFHMVWMENALLTNSKQPIAYIFSFPLPERQRRLHQIRILQQSQLASYVLLIFFVKIHLQRSIFRTFEQQRGGNNTRAQTQASFDDEVGNDAIPLKINKHDENDKQQITKHLLYLLCEKVLAGNLLNHVLPFVSKRKTPHQT